MNTPAASIVFSTKNRKDDLRTAIQSCLAQTVPVEVVVIDDGSTDGTAEMIRVEFPSARLERFESSAGYIVRRNHGARIATAPIFFTLDDDAVFTTPSIVETTLAEFSDPRIGAVGVPYVDVNTTKVTRQRAPDTRQPYAIADFRGTAGALRRELFVSLGGWREFLYHQGEEPDYCARMLSEGFVVRAGSADLIHHFESPKRDLTRQLTYNARNNLLWVWHHVPMPWLPIHMAATAVSNLRYGVRAGYVKAALKGLTWAAADILRGRAKHRPMTGRVYKVHRLLRTHGPVPMSDVLARLGAAMGDKPMSGRVA